MSMKSVDETIAFIRQVVSGRCDILDLLAIRDAINRCLEEGVPKNEIKCWHKEIDENGICENCGARAAIELEGLHPSGTKSLDMLRVSNSTEEAWRGGK